MKGKGPREIWHLPNQRMNNRDLGACITGALLLPMRKIIISATYAPIWFPLFMQTRKTSVISLLLVIGLHLGAVAAVVMTPTPPKPVDVVVPTVQGVIVMAAPENPPPPPPPPEPPPPPPPEPKPAPKPKPLPKAPPSERAVKAPEPPPPPPVETPAEPKAVEAEPKPAPVVMPNAEASELNNPAPSYPAISRRLGEQGTVTLEILVMANGNVGDIKVKKSTGFKRLDDAAVKTIRRWKFHPATQAGIAIDYRYEIDFEFSLNK